MTKKSGPTGWQEITTGCEVGEAQCRAWREVGKRERRK